jgi:hypothetical protein
MGGDNCFSFGLPPDKQVPAGINQTNVQRRSEMSTKVILTGVIGSMLLLGTVRGTIIIDKSAGIT